MKKLILIFPILLLLSVSVIPTHTFAATCDSSNPNAVYHADSFLWTCPDGSTSSSLPGVAPTPATQTAPPAATPAANTNCPNGGSYVNGACNLGYTPLEPIPGVTTVNGQAIDFPTLLGNIYKIAIIIGALFSVMMLTVSGVRYMLSDIVTDKERAKKRITACLYGLVLIAASWLILNTINPQLVTFNLNPGTATVGSPANTNISATQTSSQNVVFSGTASNYVSDPNYMQNLAASETTCTQGGGTPNVQLSAVGNTQLPGMSSMDAAFGGASSLYPSAVTCTK